MSDLGCIGSNSCFKFKIEFDDDLVLPLLVLELNVNEPVIPVVGVSFNEDVPFNINSLFLFPDIDVKIDLEVMNIDIELCVDLSSMVRDINIVLDINLFDFVS